MGVEGDELEYESDPDDALRVSAMRRREASDDEDGEGSDGQRVVKPVRKERPGLGSDEDLEGQGGAPGYDDEEEEEEEEILEEEVEEGLEDEAAAMTAEGASPEGGHDREEVFDGSAPLMEESSHIPGGEMDGYRPKNLTAGEEKKESEPYAVPTAGAFYMHDDRFQENGRGRHRRMPGGRKLWESKDDSTWLHDRFEEMNLQDSRYEERRTSRGRFRGRGNGRNRGGGRSFGRGNKPRSFYDENSDKIHAPKSVRGRGPRRYEPPSKNSEITTNQLKQSPKSQQLASTNSLGRHFSQISTAHPELAAPSKQVFASSLNSASPPFYPSSSSNQDISTLQKRDMQIGTNSKTFSSTMQMENNFQTSQSGSFVRGKAVVDSVFHERFDLDDSAQQITGKQLLSSVSSLSLPSANQSSQNKVQSRNSSSSSTPNYHPISSYNQVARVPIPNQPSVVQQKPLQAQGQSSLRISTQQVGQRLVVGTQVPSLPQAPGNPSEGGETDSPPGSSKSKASLVSKGKPGNQGAGRGSLLYGGAQVIGPTGAVGLPPGDQGFPGTPALLPVMQFGGQHPGGLAAVGMALPGYVAQPQLGFGNSEMTWVPVLAGAAGALGASYCSPYLALDGSYYARPSGQASASISSSKEISGVKPTNAQKLPQRPDLINDEVVQRQNKPRRYSEMNFGQ